MLFFTFSRVAKIFSNQMYLSEKESSKTFAFVSQTTFALKKGIWG